MDELIEIGEATKGDDAPLLKATDPNSPYGYGYIDEGLEVGTTYQVFVKAKPKPKYVPEPGDRFMANGRGLYIRPAHDTGLADCNPGYFWAWNEGARWLTSWPVDWTRFTKVDN